MPDNCPICKRELGTINIDEHHLVPKTFKGKEKFPIHKICHRKLHATFTEREMKNKYHTWESMLDNEDIQSFVKWVSKKPSDYYSGSNESKDRKAKRRR